MDPSFCLDCVEIGKWGDQAKSHMDSAVPQRQRGIGIADAVPVACLHDHANAMMQSTMNSGVLHPYGQAQIGQGAGIQHM
ncbi:MAG: hypothetical protein KJ944_21530 [Alphaproteobacteria bacterium]|nr:hypothetical protein [Alphaproteobacteria bacterium]